MNLNNRLDFLFWKISLMRFHSDVQGAKGKVRFWDYFRSGEVYAVNTYYTSGFTLLPTQISKNLYSCWKVEFNEDFRQNSENRSCHRTEPFFRLIGVKYEKNVYFPCWVNGGQMRYMLFFECVLFVLFCD